MFRVGQKVVCVEDKPMLVDIFPYRAAVGVNLIKGNVYTIRGVVFDLKGTLCVYLVEARSPLPPLSNGMERPYFATRFRPLVERKTDISIFKKMLNKRLEKV